jgi:hypothetical protein
MIDFVPVEYYEQLFYYFALVIILLMYVTINKENKFSEASPTGVVLVVALILYLGLRPINGAYFGDMSTYARVFGSFVDGETGHFEDDPGFDTFTLFCSKFFSVDNYFLLCTILYVGFHYLSAKKIFGNYWHYGFLVFVVSSSFWAYGTNGIRNGIASSFILFAFGFEKNRKIAILLALLGVSFHKSTMLPVLAFFLTFVYNKPKGFIAIWFLSIPLSLALGGAFETLFASLGFGDDRISYLTDGNVNDDEFSSFGFRWDFLLYSATAVFAGYYFIFKKGFEDKLYHRIFNVYLLSNAFWILIIRANFSNRFAYLSWFMIGLVIIYPFLKGVEIDNKPVKMARIIVLYFLFTFLLNVVFVK